MSPTLAMIVNREESIQSFVPEKFYTVCLENGLMARSERFSERLQADTLARMCEGHDAVITQIETRRKTERAPHLYDLTTLQRDANRYFGFTAQQTLDYTQSLYEKQLVTYPRTDSQYLTHDMEARIPSMVLAIGKSLPFMSGLNLKLSFTQIINDKKVSDHHAIIPTRNAVNPVIDVTDNERLILNLIAVRLVCAVCEPYVYDDLIITVKCADHLFKARARNTVQVGWKAPWNTFRGGCGTAGIFDEENILPLSEDLKEGSRYLQGFKWHDDARPKDKDDIFRRIEAEMPQVEAAPTEMPTETSTEASEETEVQEEQPKRHRPRKEINNN